MRTLTGIHFAEFRRCAVLDNLEHPDKGGQARKPGLQGDLGD